MNQTLRPGPAKAVATPEPDVAVPEGLVHVSDRDPGITRRRSGKGFQYRGPDGKALSAAERDRIRRLGIPPAYTGVWICARPDGHLQATGFDARGRKQYRYHPLWGTWRADGKYTQLADFGAALPTLRRRLDRDLRGTAGDRDFSVAALVLLLDRAFLRIGNPAYTAQNRTFGATTLLARHLTLAEGAVRLSFRAKGGRRVQHTLRDRRLIRILHDIGDLPGRNLFTYLDEAGDVRSVGSQHVNAYLADATGLAGLTAKTFRTWGGTLAAFEAALASTGRITIAMLAEAAAERLTNTPAISRKSYIHPAVLDLTELDPDERMQRLGALQPDDQPFLREPERRLLAFLRTLA